MKTTVGKKLLRTANIFVAASAIFISSFFTGIAQSQVEYPRSMPERVTLDERVAQSEFIFVGEPVRIYFVDEEYREVPYTESTVVAITPQSGIRLRRAVAEIKVENVLKDGSANVRKYVLLPIGLVSKEGYLTEISSYEEQVKKYIGHKGIWFGRLSILNEYYEKRPDESIVRKIQLTTPVELFLPNRWIAKSHSIPNPMPVDTLNDVIESLRKTKSK